MARMGRPGLSSAQKAELWQRWKSGQSLSDIGRALGKHAGSVQCEIESQTNETTDDTNSTAPWIIC